MEFATGALGTLLPKLGQLLSDEYNLQKGAKKDIEYLESELESMHAALCNIGDVPPELDKIWARDIRELSYDMEDIVDTFLVHIKQGPETPSEMSIKRFVKDMMRKITKATKRHAIAQEMKDIKKRVKEVAERRDRYKVDPVIVPAASMHDPRMAALYAKASDLVGIDEAREELILKLTREDDISMQQQRIISVFGFGGLGKTTLAKAVYDKLKAQFDCAAFVSVSRSPDKKKVLKNILYELDQEKYRSIHSEMLDEQQLINLVRKFLQNKRYFMVIDDIWETQSWEAIKLALVDENNCGSRVITTTRIFDVANVSGEIYKLQPLSYSNSKELLYLRIFGKGKCFDDQPDEISNKILKKCDGIPLAIITMASLLAGKPRKIWSELYTAIGFGDKENMQVQNTQKILSFSYYDMPPHLRTCLLYLSAFPEDYVIDKESLILMWIAEGFIHTEQGNGLFELGEKYFNDLINRSMIQAVEYDCIIQGCRVHDMVLDLICSLSKEENLFTIFHNGEGQLPQNKNKVRRLAFQRNTPQHNTHQSDHMDVSHLRSYVASVCRIDQPIPLLSFKVLRVLAIEDCQFSNDCHLENLGSLIHLRYLSVRRTNVRRLPEDIGDLKFLQTLEHDIAVLPASIARLAQLVCLSCCGGMDEVPDWIGSLTSLEQLNIEFFMPDKNKNKMRMFIKGLGSLRELKVLRFILWCSSEVLTDKGAHRDLVESLRKLQKIQHLHVQDMFNRVCEDKETWDAAGFMLPRHLCHLSLCCVRFSNLPPCVDLSSLHHLSYVELLWASEHDLKLLSRLRELCCLKLHGCTEATITVTASSKNAGQYSIFPKLRFLEMHSGMVHLEHNEGDSSFSLYISNGRDSLPFGSSAISSRRHNSCCSALSATVMPNLEVISAKVSSVWALKDSNGEYSSFGLQYLTSLRRVKLVIGRRFGFGTSSTTTDKDKAEAVLRYALNAHPNRPTFEVQKRSRRRRRRSEEAE